MATQAPRSVVVTAVIAALVTVVALAAVVALRIERERADAEGNGALFGPADDDAASACGDSPCGVLTSVPLGSTTVELLADADGGHGRVRVREPESDIVIETALAAMGVRLSQNSLVCSLPETRVCLVRGRHDGGVVGEVFVGRDNWQPAERPYFSSGGYIDLVNVSGDDSPEIVVAKEDCGSVAEECADAPIVVEVFALDGKSVGCTQPYGSLRELPGWPTVELAEGDMRGCG
ncbi:MAG: hypothetical protein ACRDQW_11855 [Haloechinothrix sp.]